MGRILYFNNFSMLYSTATEVQTILTQFFAGAPIILLISLTLSCSETNLVSVHTYFNPYAAGG